MSIPYKSPDDRKPIWVLADVALTLGLSLLVVAVLQERWGVAIVLALVLAVDRLFDIYTEVKAIRRMTEIAMTPRRIVFPAAHGP